MAKEVTMKDIAASMGISTVTVSKALTGRDGVSADVRKQIKAKAKEMGYKYSSTKSGKESRKFNIGVLVENHYIQDQISSFYFKMYQHIIMKLSPAGYSAILEIITPQMLENNDLPQVVNDNKVDGIIALGKIKKEYLNKIRETDIPVVFLDYYDRNMEVPSVITDNVYGTYVLTSYLIKNGHKKIAYVGDIYATPSILDRYLGYIRAHIVNDIEIRKDYVICDRDSNGIFIDLELPEDMPTAFVCNCDDIAALLIDKLKSKGYRVPEDISIVGFDNSTLSEYTSPKLTTLEVDMDKMTGTACDLLTRMIAGDTKIKGRQVISGNLVIRESVADISPLGV